MADENYKDVQFTTFIWHVKYPNLFQGCNVYSPSFSVDSFGNTSFCIKLLSEREDNSHNYVSLFLEKYKKDYGPIAIAFKVKLAISNNDGAEEYNFEDIVAFDKKHAALLERFLSFKKNYRPVSLLTLHLEIEPVVNDVDECKWVCNQQDLESLSNDLGRALKSKLFCDLTLRSIEDRPIPSHKTIVATRYPNLATALNLQENHAREEYNLGIDLNGINMLLQYIYCGKIDTGNATYGLHNVLKKAELYHLQYILYPVPRIIHATTSVPVKFGSFIWVVPMFNSLPKNKVLVNTLCCDSKLEWTKLRILLSIRRNYSSEKCLSFKIQQVEECKLYMICIISLIGDAEYARSYEVLFQSKREFTIPSFVETEFIEEKADSFVFNNTLKIRLDFILSDLKEISEYDAARCLEVQRGQLSPVATNLWALHRDLKNLYMNPSYSDVTLRVDEKLLPAHKVILSARSQFFSNLFEHETEETKTGQVEVEDFDAPIVLSMLLYIYCGEVHDKSMDISFAIDLYRAADSYKVPQLIEKCALVIGAILSVSNVSKVLKFADKYKDKYLIECVKNFVCSNTYAVFEEADWKILMKERVDLTGSIMNAALQSKLG